MQVKTAAFFGVVDVEQFLESAHDMFEVMLSGRWGLDVEDFAGFIDAQVGGCDGITRGGLLAFVFAGCLGLLVGFGEGAAEDSGSGHDDLRDDAMSLKYISL